MPIKILGAVALACFVSVAAAQTPTWREGTNYYRVEPAQPTSVPPGKVEVTEVFSFACPACNAFYPIMDRLRESLPPEAAVDYVAASFNPQEDWVGFQRAYYAAKALGIDAKTHDAMFNAVWQTGKLATFNRRTRRLKRRMPTIEDVARWYHRHTGVATQRFLAAATSFGVAMKMHEANQYVLACQVSGTPTIIVNGKYRVTVASAGGYNQIIQVVDWLVAKCAKQES